MDNAYELKVSTVFCGIQRVERLLTGIIDNGLAPDGDFMAVERLRK